MPRPDFRSLRNELLRSGVAPRHVRRTVLELSDHFDDLVDAGASEQQAMKELGELNEIRQAVLARPELRSWAYRFPHIALFIYPLTCLVLLPVVPVFAGVAHASYLGRWTASIVLSGLVTAAMFLVLQLIIVLS